MTHASDYLSDIGADVVRKPRKRAIRKKDPVMAMAQGTLSAFIGRHFSTIAKTMVIGVLLGAAAINPVFLQKGKHPSPIFAQTGASQRGIDQTRTAAIPTPKSKQIVIGKESVPNFDPLVRQIQRLLYERGYYKGDVDGIMGAKTRDAIGDYQRTFAQTVDYRVSQGLLDHIRLSTSDITFHNKARARLQQARSQHVKTKGPQIVTNTVNLESHETVRRVQQALLDLGLGELDVDGLIGPNTRKAIGSFQRRRGLQESGHITEETLSELGRLNVY